MGDDIQAFDLAYWKNAAQVMAGEADSLERERDEARQVCDEWQAKYAERIAQVRKLERERDEARAELATVDELKAELRQRHKDKMEARANCNEALEKYDAANAKCLVAIGRSIEMEAERDEAQKKVAILMPALQKRTKQRDEAQKLLAAMSEGAELFLRERNEAHRDLEGLAKVAKKELDEARAWARKLYRQCLEADGMMNLIEEYEPPGALSMHEAARQGAAMAYRRCRVTTDAVAEDD